MIAIAAHGVADIDAGPLAEIEMIVVWVPGNGPAIEQFIHHEKAHAIAQIEKLGRRRIVRGADGVDTKLPEHFKAAFPCAQRHRRAKGARIMMQTHAFDFEVPSVQPESSVSIKVNLANAEGRGLFV